MKVIDERIKYLLREKEVLLEEYPQTGIEQQLLLSMINVRIALELKFLTEILNEIPKKPDDEVIDKFFPLSTSNAEIKRKAVKLFIKHKL